MRKETYAMKCRELCNRCLDFNVKGFAEARVLAHNPANNFKLEEIKDISVSKDGVILIFEKQEKKKDEPTVVQRTN